MFLKKKVKSSQNSPSCQRQEAAVSSLLKRIEWLARESSHNAGGVCCFGERDRGDGLISGPDIYEPDITLPANLGSWLGFCLHRAPSLLVRLVGDGNHSNKNPCRMLRARPAESRTNSHHGGWRRCATFPFPCFLASLHTSNVAITWPTFDPQEGKGLHRWCEQSRRIQTSRVSGMLRYSNQRAPYHLESFPFNLLALAWRRVASR